MITGAGNTLWGNLTNAGQSTTQILTRQVITSDAQSSTITSTRTDLIGSLPIVFMRSRIIKINIVDTKPNTRLYAFFDGTSIDDLITPAGLIQGAAAVTDAQGRLVLDFYIPPFTFKTGSRVFRVQDTPLLSTNIVPGAMVGSASAIYYTQGVLETFKETQDSLRTITMNIVGAPPAVVINEVTTVTTDVIDSISSFSDGSDVGPADPLAQSFFTYGIIGGCFVTSLDIFFSTKDNTLPVWVELREVVNGYPGAALVSRFARKSLLPTEVAVSSNSSLPTKFKFDIPVYLNENKEYCFVLRTNSMAYHVFTSQMGAKSIENTLTIFEQPHLGSMFKSQNNSTWTAEQSEDIKFTLYQAVFDTSSTNSYLTYTAKSVPTLLMGANFLVTIGSNVITVCTQHQHGLITNNKISLVAKEGGVFRGISAANLTGDFVITSISDYVFIFSASVVATSTGSLATPGFVNKIIVDDGGAGYNIVDAAIVITSAPGTFTTAATATPVIAGGVITSITLTNIGAGYTVAPTITITGGHTPGRDAVAKLICESIFILTTNNIVAGYKSQIVNHIPIGSKITTDLITTSESYAVSSPTRITSGYYRPVAPSILLSTVNATQNIFNSIEPAGTSITMGLSSTNSNVSPMIVVHEPPQLSTFAYIINNQSSIEDFESTSASAIISSVSMTQGFNGSGYTTATVTVEPPHLSDGVQAVVTATVSGGQVTALAVVTAGTGYLKPPKLTIAGDGTGAIGSAILSGFNSELLAFGGSARSKYFTKQFTLVQISKGAQLNLTAISTAESNVDVYMRTSLTSASLIHTDLNWTKMNCPVERNLSSNSTQELDYVFTLEDLSPFDIYDLKIVLRSTNRMVIPTVTGYRCIILAT